MSDTSTPKPSHFNTPALLCASALIGFGLFSYSPVGKALVGAEHSQVLYAGQTHPYLVVPQPIYSDVIPAAAPRSAPSPSPAPAAVVSDGVMRAQAGTVPMPTPTAVPNAPGSVPLDMQVIGEDAQAALNIIDQHTGFEVAMENVNASGKPIYAIFDPQCPYCHQAYDEIARDAPIRWLPVALVGDPQKGQRLISQLAQEIGVAPGSARQLLDAAFGNQLAAADPATDAAKTINAQNISLLATLADSMNRGAGVPLFAVPLPDGTLAFHSGYARGDHRKIVNVYHTGVEAAG